MRHKRLQDVRSDESVSPEIAFEALRLLITMQPRYRGEVLRLLFPEGLYTGQTPAERKERV